MNDNMRVLNMIPLFWQEFGFELWAWNGLEGAHRRITFRKGSLLGEVASYYVDDYIIWDYRDKGQEGAVRLLLETWQPETDVMNHRFLVLGSGTGSRPLRRSFWLGLRGWIEVLPFSIGGADHDNFKDLIFLATNGLRFALKEVCDGSKT